MQQNGIFVLSSTFHTTVRRCPTSAGAILARVNLSPRTPRPFTATREVPEVPGARPPHAASVPPHASSVRPSSRSCPRPAPPAGHDLTVAGTTFPPPPYLHPDTPPPPQLHPEAAMGLIRRADGDKRVKATKAAAAAVAVAPQRPPPHTRRRRRSRRRRLGAPSRASAARRLRRSHRHRCGLDGIGCHRGGRRARRSVCDVRRGAAERGCGRVACRVRVGGGAARRQQKRIYRWGRRPPPVLAAAMRSPPRRRLEAAAVAHPRRLAGGARL